jgi:hypothetical protein
MGHVLALLLNTESSPTLYVWKTNVKMSKFWRIGITRETDIRPFRFLETNLLRGNVISLSSKSSRVRRRNEKGKVGRDDRLRSESSKNT